MKTILSFFFSIFAFAAPPLGGGPTSTHIGWDAPKLGNISPNPISQNESVKVYHVYDTVTYNDETILFIYDVNAPSTDDWIPDFAGQHAMCVTAEDSRGRESACSNVLQYSR